MAQKALAGIILLLIVVGGGILIFGFSTPGLNVRISGYDGLTSTITGIDHSYEDVNAQEQITATTASIDPILGVGTANPTGLRAELGQPEVTGQRLDWSDSNIQLDEDAGTNTTDIFEAHIIEMEMGVVIRTFGEGYLTIVDVTFWFDLKETSSSVFSTADESEAYIIFVETKEYATLEGDIDVTPVSGGKELELTTVQKDEPPQWILDSGYTTDLKYFKHVQFPITCLEATPDSFFGWFRQEAQATIRLQVEVLLFGHWEVVQQYNPIDPPPIPDLFKSLVAFLQDAAVVVGGFVGMVVILYVAPRKWKLLGPVLFVVVVLYTLGVFDSVLGALG